MLFRGRRLRSREQFLRGFLSDFPSSFSAYEFGYEFGLIPKPKSIMCESNKGRINFSEKEETPGKAYRVSWRRSKFLNHIMVPLTWERWVRTLGMQSRVS